MQESTLSLHTISKSFKQGMQELCIFEHVNQIFKSNESYVITGASGSGKSTLLHIIAGLEAPTQGYVCFNNTNLQSMSTQEKEFFFNTQIGLVFQLPYLITELSVLENVMIKGMISGMNSEECKEQAYALLNHVGLASKTADAPHVLSGGQQQRVALARALFNKPTFLIADEPTGNLDKKTGQELIELLKAYHEEHSMGLIISSHDPSIVQAMKTTLTLKNNVLVHDIKEQSNVQTTTLQLSA